MDREPIEYDAKPAGMLHSSIATQSEANAALHDALSELSAKLAPLQPDLLKEDAAAGYPQDTPQWGSEIARRLTENYRVTQEATIRVRQLIKTVEV